MRRKHGTKSAGPTEQDAFELGAIYTDFKSDLIAFTQKEGSSYSFASVAARMANLFQAEAIREQLRTGERLPEMPKNGSANHSGRPAESGYDDLEPAPALPAGAPGNQPLNRIGNKTGFHTVSEAGRRNIAEAQRLRWQKIREKKAKKLAATKERWERFHQKQKAKNARVKGSPEYERQRAQSKQSKGAKSYWAQFTDAQKSEIMKARKAIAAEKKKASL